MIYVENKNFVIPGQVLADDDYYSGRGTFKEDGKVCSSLMGRVSAPKIGRASCRERV